MVDFDVSLDRTALINVDLQNFFVDTTKDGSALVERINELSAVCREAGILVVHTAHVLRPDGSNIGVLGEIISEIREGLLNKGAETASFYPELHIDPRDLVLEKPRFGAFYGPTLSRSYDLAGSTLSSSPVSRPTCAVTRRHVKLTRAISGSCS